MKLTTRQTETLRRLSRIPAVNLTGDGYHFLTAATSGYSYWLRADLRSLRALERRGLAEFDAGRDEWRITDAGREAL